MWRLIRTSRSKDLSSNSASVSLLDLYCMTYLFQCQSLHFLGYKLWYSQQGCVQEEVKWWIWLCFVSGSMVYKYMAKPKFYSNYKTSEGVLPEQLGSCSSTDALGANSRVQSRKTCRTHTLSPQPHIQELMLSQVHAIRKKGTFAAQGESFARGIQHFSWDTNTILSQVIANWVSINRIERD